MARVKLSEFTAKLLLYPVFGLKYQGVSFSSQPPKIPANGSVLKVDQGVKKRGKQGLIKLNIKENDLQKTLKSWSKTGYSQFLLEPMHTTKGREYYLALERTREGWLLSHSDEGGVEIESNWQTVKKTLLQKTTQKLPNHPVLSKVLPALLARLDQLHISFLEINPYIIRGKQIIPLDMAVEIDSAGLKLAERVSSLEITPVQDSNQTASEKRIAKLDESTPAALKFKLLNNEGRIWMLLSGGGASLVLADEVADLGLGKELANYGEYSGAPSTDDTYAYTKIILTEILKSKNKKSKALVIAGGVANFTDVASTFKGVIRALDEVKGNLESRGLKVFVRRGGPNEEQGLKIMKDFLQAAGLLGSVHGHTIALTNVITKVRKYLS